MGTPKKSHDLIRQNEQVVKKAQMHDANLRKNTTLYFQVGLIICLLATYGLLEMKFEMHVPTDYGARTPDNVTFYVDVPVIKSKIPVFEEPVEQKRVKQPTDFVEVPDDTPDNLFIKNPDKPKIDQPVLDPSSIKVVKAPDEVPIPINFIEQVPIYPGCEREKSNEGKRKCMSDNITKLVQKQFDTDLAGVLGLYGKQVIQTQFKIDKTGHVTDIQTRAAHPKLQAEAERVINKIPEMIPGKQKHKPVDVIYTLPIVLNTIGN